MYPIEYPEAELAYRREHLAHAFRAGAGRGVTASRRQHHHLLARKHDRRG